MRTTSMWSWMLRPIAELVNTVAQVTGYQGRIKWDPDKPDGAPRKLMDSSKLNSLGWQPRYTLKEGLTDAYQWFVDYYESLSKERTSKQ